MASFLNGLLDSWKAFKSYKIYMQDIVFIVQAPEVKKVAVVQPASTQPGFVFSQLCCCCSHQPKAHMSASISQNKEVAKK